MTFKPLHRLLLLPGILLVIGMACNLPGTAVAPTAQAPTLQSGPFCGDGVCSGPENADICPADCPAPATESPTQSPVSNLETPSATAVASVEHTLTIGAPLAGQPIRPLLGVNVGPIAAGEGDNPDLTAEYREYGVTMVRTHDFYGPLDMATLYPDQSADPANSASYDFGRSDEVFAAIVGAGLEPYFRVGDSWNNSTGYPPADPRRPTDPENWTRAAVEVVRHYRALAEQAGAPFRYVEIWNEPDGAQFWDGSPIEFYRLFEQTAVALKAEFPDLQIGGPGFSPAGYAAPRGQQFSRGLLDHLQATGAPLDFLSWHVYASEPEAFVEAARYYRALLDEYGYAATESHITEWNTQFRDAQTDDPAVRTGAPASAILTSAWIALQQEGVHASTFYRGTEPSIEMRTWFGLFYADARPKPAALAWKLWAATAAHPNRLELTGEDGALWALAGQDGDGEVAVLVANPSGMETSYALAGIAADTPLRILQISAPATEVEEFTATVAGLSIPAYGVQLVLAGGSQ